jgi:hypothetical protein
VRVSRRLYRRRNYSVSKELVGTYRKDFNGKDGFTVPREDLT